MCLFILLINIGVVEGMGEEIETGTEMGRDITIHFSRIGDP